MYVFSLKTRSSLIQKFEEQFHGKNVDEKIGQKSIQI